MKLTRRSLLGLIRMGAAAAALAPAESVEAARTPAEIANEIEAHVGATYPQESDRWAALAEDMLMNPEQHPELMARVREMMGEPSTIGFYGASPVRGDIWTAEMWNRHQSDPSTDVLEHMRQLGL